MRMPDTSVPVTLWGLVRGAEVAGRGQVALVDGRLVHIALDDREPLDVPCDRLDGVRIGDRELSIFATTGDVIELGGDERVHDLGERIADIACTVPELTRGLRVFGTARWHPGEEHDHFFAPFMLARRAARRAENWRGRVTALDATHLRNALSEVLTTFARDHYPRQAAERRALETELFDVTAPAFDALDRLGAAAQAALLGNDDTLFARWRAWTGACRAVFEAVDRCWVPLSLALAAARPQKRNLWAKVWRKGALLRRFTPARSP